MQKFTRAITREVELGGERLALTFDAEGISVRPVGSRRPPFTCSWASVVHHLTRQSGGEPTPEDIAGAISRLKGAKATDERPASPAREASPPEEEPRPAPATAEGEMQTTG